MKIVFVTGKEYALKVKTIFAYFKRLQRNMFIVPLRKLFVLTISGKRGSNNCEHKTQWTIEMLILPILNIFR